MIIRRKSGSKGPLFAFRDKKMHFATWMLQGRIDFSKLSDEEKCDWALDIIVLFLLGHITEISDEIFQYIRRYVKTMVKKNPVDKGIALYIFELYLTGQEEKKYLPMQYVSNKPMESLFVLLEIDKIIIERWV